MTTTYAIDENHPEVIHRMKFGRRTLEQAIAFVEKEIADMRAADERYRTGNLTPGDRANAVQLAAYWHQRNWDNAP